MKAMSDLPSASQQPPAIPGYEHVRYLGRGCWGQVHLYRQGSTGALYSCKFFDPDHVAQKQMQDRGWTADDVWKKECLGGNTRSLPGLAYGSLEQLPDGTRFFRREYVDRVLSDAINGSRIPLEDIVLVARGIAAGLQSIHGALGLVYGDLKPDNVAFTTQQDVKLLDFGAATVGESPRKYGGELFTRAPERFEADVQNLHPSSDVWSAGAILYRLLTGSYPLEQELHGAHHPEEIVRALYASSSSWNKRMAEKIDRATPRAFRPLLVKSLSHDSVRLKDGKEFSGELEKAVRRYHHSTPRARFVRAAAGLAGLVIAAGAGAYPFNVHAQQENLQQEVVKAEKALSLEKKIHIVRLYVAKVDFPPDYNELSEIGKLQGWVDIFGDKKTAVAAYLNKDAVARAILETGGKSDFQSIENILSRIDNSLVGSVYAATGTALDSWAWRIRADSKQGIIAEWRQAQNDLTERCNGLLREYRDLQREVEEYSSQAERAAGIAEDILSEKKTAAKGKQDKLLETLSSLTGKTAFDLDSALKDPSFTFSMPALQQPPQSAP